MRPQLAQRSVTCERGGGGVESGSRTMSPEQEGQLSGIPLRSCEMSCSAWAGLYVAGRGLRIESSRVTHSGDPSAKADADRARVLGQQPVPPPRLIVETLLDARTLSHPEPREGWAGVLRPSARRSPA